MYTPVSLQELDNARQDAESLEKVINGTENEDVTTRLGETYPTLSKFINNSESLVQSSIDAVIDGNMITDELVSVGSGETQADKNAEFELDKFDTGITVTPQYVGAVARTQAEKNSDIVTAKDFGLTNNAILAALKVSAVRLTSGEYTANGFIKVDMDRPTVLVGEGSTSEIIKTTANSPAVLQVQNSKTVRLKDFKINLQYQSISSVGSAVSLIDADDAVVDGLDIKGFAGLGSMVQAYPTSELVQSQHQVIKNSKGFGSRSESTNTNGFLITNGKFSRLQNLFVSGVAAYAVEYKNRTTHSLMLDSIVTDSVSAFAYGQTTSDDSGVSYSVAANLISLDNSTAWANGKGKYNLTSNVLAHNTVSGSHGNKEGIRLDGTANYNSMCNFLFAGTFNNAVRLGASYNYVSASFFIENNASVVYTSGAKGNTVEVQHSGTKTSILPTVQDNSGSSGLDRNVTYCHGTGEYLGSRSGRWRWQHTSSSVAPVATGKWVFEGLGDSNLNIVTDGLGAAGIALTTPTGTRYLNYIDSGDYWKLSNKDNGYRFYSSAIRPEVDNTSSIGNPTFKFSTAYLDTAPIVTSDERLKTDILAISAAEKRAALKIKESIGRYQFTNTVDSKGDKARYHFGVGAQTVGQILRDEGLNPDQYAFYCYDEWEATEETEAGNRYGIRYDELSMFLHAAT